MQHEHRCSRVQDVSFRDVKIKIPDWGMWMTSCTRSERRIWGDLKKSVRELRTGHRTRRVDFRGSLRPDEFARYGTARDGGGRWKSQNRKNVYLSPYVEEPLNSKVIKSFVPELRSSVFCVLGFLCSMYICYEHSMYVSHISVSWVWYTETITDSNFTDDLALLANTSAQVLASQLGL